MKERCYVTPLGLYIDPDPDAAGQGCALHKRQQVVDAPSGGAEVVLCLAQRYPARQQRHNAAVVCTQEYRR